MRVAQRRSPGSGRLLAQHLVGQLHLDGADLLGEGGELRLAGRVLEQQAVAVGLLAGHGEQRPEHEPALARAATRRCHSSASRSVTAVSTAR